jgi:hypothetical protein
MSQTITSADCTITMTVTNLYPSGFQFEEFEAQNIFDMGDTEMAETTRTADGKLVQVSCSAICRGHSISILANPRKN